MAWKEFLEDTEVSDIDLHEIFLKPWRNFRDGSIHARKCVSLEAQLGPYDLNIYEDGDYAAGFQEEVLDLQENQVLWEIFAHFLITIPRPVME